MNAKKLQTRLDSYLSAIAEQNADVRDAIQAAALLEGDSELEQKLDALDATEVAAAELVATLELTHAQLLDLDNTPVEIVPAPGEGFAIMLHRAVVSVEFVTTAYDTNGNLFLAPESEGTNDPIAGFNNVVGLSSGVRMTTAGLGLDASGGQATLREDDALVVVSDDAITEVGTADSIVKVRVWYSIVDFPL